MEDEKEEMPEEVVYTKYFDGALEEDTSPNADKQRGEFLEFVNLIEKHSKQDATDEDKNAIAEYKHTPTFDSEGESYDPPGDDADENDPFEDKDGHADEAWARVGHQTMDGCILQKVGERSCKLEDSEAVKLAKFICSFNLPSIIAAKARNAVFTASWDCTPNKNSPVIPSKTYFINLKIRFYDYLVDSQII